MVQKIYIHKVTVRTIRPEYSEGPLGEGRGRYPFPALLTTAATCDAIFTAEMQESKSDC